MEAFAPTTLAEALEIRAEHPEVVPIAGGTDLMVDMNARRIRPAALLDLSRVGELREWGSDNGRMHVGAGVTFARIERELQGFPPLVDAARSVASPQIRNRATIGGNIATASPAGDSLPVLAAYDADVVLASARAGERRVPLTTFLVGPKRTSLAPDELIVGVEWARVVGPASFVKVGRRNAMVIAIASACLQADDDACGVRLALGSVAPTVVRAPLAERFAERHDWGAPATLAEFGRLAASEARPIDDVRGSAAYRRHAVGVLARRALQHAGDARC